MFSRIVCLILIFGATGRQFPEPFWWRLIHCGRDDSCGKNSPYLTGVYNQLPKRHVQMIRRQPGILPILIKSLLVAQTHCQSRLNDRQWNCTVNGDTNRPVFWPISGTGCREAALVYASVSSSLVYHVARSCKSGRLSFCSCDVRFRGPSDNHWSWNGCSDNVKYALKYVKRFTDAEEVGADIRYKMNTHNNKAGRVVVRKSMKTQCYCHGTSASCSLKTCWRSLASFDEVSSKLRARFDNAFEIDSQTFLNTETVDRRRRSSTESESPKDTLVFFEESPNLCSFLPDLSKGRVCGRRPACEVICCRGHQHRSVFRVASQNCTVRPPSTVCQQRLKRHRVSVCL